MRTLLISSSPRFAENLMLALENLDESWQVRWQSTLPAVLHAELLLLASPQNPSFMAELFAHPPLPSAYLLTLAAPHPVRISASLPIRHWRRLCWRRRSFPG